MQGHVPDGNVKIPTRVDGDAPLIVPHAGQELAPGGFGDLENVPPVRLEIVAQEGVLILAPAHRPGRMVLAEHDRPLEPGGIDERTPALVPDSVPGRDAARAQVHPGVGREALREARLSRAGP